jgi:FkbM family methyltransferase
MSILNDLFLMAVKPAQKLLSCSSKMTSRFIEGVDIVRRLNTKHGNILLATNNALTYYRAETFFTKEADTLAWIDSFQEDDVFFDIGANVGVFSLYAGRRKVKTISFEPESQNYAELNKNIFLNSLDSKVSAFNIALSDETKADYLYLSRFYRGAALHNFGEKLDFNKENFTPAMQQSVCSYTLKEFIKLFNLPHPTHIKIDVDGLEDKVFAGAEEIIKSEQTKSVLIELNTTLAEDNHILDKLKEYGYFVISQHQAPNLNKEFHNVYNFIFSREKIKLTY